MCIILSIWPVHTKCAPERDGVNLHLLIPTQVFSIAFESMSLTPKQMGDILIWN